MNPQFLTAYKKEAEQLLKAEYIRELIFSGKTYEIEVWDEQTKSFVWVFMQVDDEGNLLDYFCSCSSFSEKACVHLAASYLKITEKEKPLHVRFQESFWNRIFLMLAKRIGFEKKIQRKDQEFLFTSKTGKKLFFIKAKTKEFYQKLKKGFFEREIETEETSIKFSNLSQEELLLWRKKNPSFSLSYELSFFSDLAKLFFLMQDKGETYKVEFLENELPNEVVCEFLQVVFGFYISEANWDNLVSSLTTIQSNVRFLEKTKDLKIFFDEELVSFQIAGEEMMQEKGILVGSYLYKDQTFYSRSGNFLLDKKIIHKNEIGDYLQKYPDLFIKYKMNYEINDGIYSLFYDLFFDRQNNLHIKGYLFQKNDILEKYFFHKWVFLPLKGFYRVKELCFDKLETIVLKKDLVSFLAQHKHFLNKYPGFQIHLRQLETKIIYSVNEKGDLFLFPEVEFSGEEKMHMVDIDGWIYIKGRGFYKKKIPVNFFRILKNIQIPKKDLSEFIHRHFEELKQITSFFLSSSPIETIGLELFRIGHEIEISPKIQCRKGIQVEDIIFYDSYGYLKEKGFFKLPSKMQFPEKYKKKKRLTQDELTFFYSFEYDLLKSSILSIDPSVKPYEKIECRLRNIRSIKKGKKISYAVNLFFMTDIGRVDALKVWEKIHENQDFYFSSAGMLYLKQQPFNFLKKIKRGQINPAKNEIRFSLLEWMRLYYFEEIIPPPEKEFNIFEMLETDKLLDLSSLKADLRSYQKTGIKWLFFLYTHGLSGLLCDEMGLGKTHQAMALIAASNEKEKKYLIVCPTSVIYHWQEQLKRFLPSFSVVTYHGPFRSLDKIRQKEILLTSYGILRSDQKILEKIQFEIAVFDEMQIAKNSSSKIHKTLCRISSHMKLGLTGTPIENHLKELKALFDIILPHYLFSDAFFQKNFITPIEKEKNEEVLLLLKKMIQPFILRRKKKDVLLDLPDKTEEIAYADLSEEQFKLYQSLLEDPAVKDLEDPSKPISYIHVFSLLTKLKQLCDHPSLILKDFSSFMKHKSGKFDLFIELLNEALESEQKIVVFSQYVEMIRIMETYLKKRNISYACITGSTKDRAGELKKFHDDKNCKVFLGSLLAAGVGIDLTKASIVIHYDRWWNPAKENQATDRVHRIGQNRGVQVFKLVTKNTIEEHIHALIDKKIDLIEKTIAKDDVNTIKVLSRDELLSIIKGLKKQ